MPALLLLPLGRRGEGRTGLYSMSVAHDGGAGPPAPTQAVWLQRPDPLSAQGLQMACESRFLSPEVWAGSTNG